MTLSGRNLFLKIGIFLCAVVVLSAAAVSFLILPAYSNFENCVFGENARRPDYIFQVITGNFLGSSFYAVHFALIFAAIFSLVCIFLIHYFFERTPAPELLFIALFTISISFEVLRLFLPLQLVYNFPSVYLRITARILLFARTFGIFSIFVAGLCAAGLEIQKTRNALFILVIAALVIPIGIPIDAHSWDTSFNLITGYTQLFRTIELIVLITTMISFFIAAKARNSKAYVYAAAGVMLALLGRNILLGTDNWLGAAQGLSLLAFGTSQLCSKVHKIHLWL